MMSYSNSKTAGNDFAANWGSAIDMATIPQWAQQSVAENVLYTRTFLGQNPDVVQSDGTVDLGNFDLTFPADLSGIFDKDSTSSSTTSATGTQGTDSPATSATSSSSSAASATTSTTSGARVNAASAGVAGVVAFAVAFFAL